MKFSHSSVEVSSLHACIVPCLIYVIHLLGRVIEKSRVTWGLGFGLPFNVI